MRDGFMGREESYPGRNRLSNFQSREGASPPEERASAGDAGESWPCPGEEGQAWDLGGGKSSRHRVTNLSHPIPRVGLHEMAEFFPGTGRDSVSRCPRWLFP